MHLNFSNRPIYLSLTSQVIKLLFVYIFFDIENVIRSGKISSENISNKSHPNTTEKVKEHKNYWRSNCDYRRRCDEFQNSKSRVFPGRDKRLISEQILVWKMIRFYIADKDASKLFYKRFPFTNISRFFNSFKCNGVAPLIMGLLL